MKRNETAEKLALHWLIACSIWEKPSSGLAVLKIMVWVSKVSLSDLSSQFNFYDSILMMIA